MKILVEDKIQLDSSELMYLYRVLHNMERGETQNIAPTSNLIVRSDSSDQENLIRNESSILRKLSDLRQGLTNVIKDMVLDLFPTDTENSQCCLNK